MTPARLRLLACMMLGAGIAGAAAQTATAPTFDALLHTRRLLRSGAQGQKVRVGVISNGASFYTTLARQRILPPITFYGGDASHGDEGDWMLQIVHRIAPRARLAFCPGGPPGRTVACARDLVAQFHADIVVDDTNPQPVYAFPDDKDIGYAELSREHPDVLFFTGAGNNGGGYYEGRWTPTEIMLHDVRYEAQDFGASLGGPGDPYERLGAPPGAAVSVVLGTNADPNGSPRCSTSNPDVTLALVDGADEVLRSVHGRCPVLSLSDPQPPRDARSLSILVLLPPGRQLADLRLKLVAIHVGGEGVTPLPLEYWTRGGAGNSATMPHLIAVAAVDPNTGWHERFLFEPFANSGPQCMQYLHDGVRWTALPAPRCYRQPAFVVPDGMPVVMPGTGEERYAPFYGNSAAGPAAAGVAALLLSAHVPAKEIIGLLERTAIPQGDAPGWNAHYGYGVLDADAAAARAGALPPVRRPLPATGIVPLFHRTAAFLEDQQLARQARQGDRAALKQLRGAAQEGQADAQAWLARYEHDIGNEALAAHWALMAADRGEPYAQNLLGSLYNRGWGVPTDPRAAQAWWWRAARTGLPAAMYNMGTTLTDGRGAPANPEVGYALMRAAFVRGLRIPAMVRAMALARLHMTFGQIGAAERLVPRFASDPGSIPPP